MAFEYEEFVTKKAMELTSFPCGKCGKHFFAVYGNYESFNIYGVCLTCKTLMQFSFKLENKPTGKQ